jgi:UDP-N-acetylmuramoylalanine-D-glutamate ligase
MKLSFAKGKRYAVVGMGKTGRATATALRTLGLVTVWFLSRVVALSRDD